MGFQPLSKNHEKWIYSISIIQETRGHRQPFLKHEKVYKGNNLISDRPNEDDKKDKERLTQTHLEQINANIEFREIAKFFESIYYLHIVPQLLRHPEMFIIPSTKEDPFGKSFLEKVARTPEKTRKSK